MEANLTPNRRACVNPPLLLLPGMMCDVGLFGSPISELAEDTLSHAPHRLALAGHLLVLEQPKLTNKEIKLWLNT